MLIFFGIRNITIRKYYDEQAACSICGGYKKEYRVYQPCFHIFWIPVFPFGKKYLSVTCKECSMRYDTREHAYIAETRTPKYVYTGLIILMLPFILLLLLFIISLIIHVPKRNRELGYIPSTVVLKVDKADSFVGNTRIYKINFEI